MSLIDELVRDTIGICRIPAPTGREGERGRHVARELERLGVAVSTDAVGNVVGEVPGEDDLPAVAVAAHLDTVFPDRDEIEVETRDGWLHAPGVGDNSAGVAALLSLARRLPRSGLGPLLLVASVGEEGNGDLRGVRHLFEEGAHRIDAFFAVEGGMADRLVTAAVGAERLAVTVRGPGGHSWADAGRPSALDGAARLVADLYDLSLSEDPPASLNVGTVAGGTTVNSIAAETRLELDLRSTDAAVLDDLRRRALAAIRGRFPGDGVLGVETAGTGSRPAGRLDSGHPILEHARAARAELGLRPADEVSCSTDANVPLARGVPATCLGIGEGVDAHKASERLRIEGMDRGFSALLATVVRVATDPAIRGGSAPSGSRPGR